MKGRLQLYAARGLKLYRLRPQKGGGGGPRSILRL